MAGRRSDTRERIQQVALELFAEHGYEKTSLREIAERLEVTKAALYYHFKTKEDIVHSLVEKLVGAFDELLHWGSAQPRTHETTEEVLRRFSSLVNDEYGSEMQFIQQNVPTLKKFGVMMPLGQKVRELFQLVGAEGDDPATELKARLALVALVLGINPMFGGPEAAPPPEVALKVALELVAPRP
ncbi:TetR/AcrR family transcriptional regulator [Prauserella cavernicola]|uniref:TetR/AcrR family transcriptional regulator n=1 Tax=Prauserella cavernicola TaxID=2800127 RepID=A0A934QNZ0_9PSEU|nr:TetR/AcrR family transcriptional regulator [Prauserella cavernicola]MBK1785542.1 TetR/AcrR family transcriptional regulator [Prauserella cavernicola]